MKLISQPFSLAIIDGFYSFSPQFFFCSLLLSVSGWPVSVFFSSFFFHRIYLRWYGLRIYLFAIYELSAFYGSCHIARHIESYTSFFLSFSLVFFISVFPHSVHWANWKWAWCVCCICEWVDFIDSTMWIASTYWICKLHFFNMIFIPFWLNFC